MQKDLAADIELNLKKKARRRLVGAIALVLLLTSLLPFLLKDRSQFISNDHVSIALENENGVIVTEELIEDLPNDFDSKVVPETATQQESKPIELPLPKNVADSNKVFTTKDTEAKTLAQKKPAEIVKSIRDLNIQTTNKPATEKKSTTENEKKNVDISTSNVAEKKQEISATKGGQFYVQIGAFSDASKVKLLQSKMHELGYQSKTEKIKTEKGELIRLKSQTFSSRNEAAIALANMKDAGLTGMVVSQ